MISGDLTTFEQALLAFQAVFSTWQTGGKLAGVSALLMLLVRLIRSDLVQNLLPESFKWDSLPWYAKLGLPFILAGSATLLGALAAGTAPIAALIAAIAAGASAVGLHHLTKAVGSATTPAIPAEDLSAMRKAAAALFPIDASKLPPKLSVVPPPSNAGE